MSCIAGPRQFGTEDQGWIAHFLYSALARQPLVVYGDGRQVRDVLFVGDLMRAFAAVSENVQRCAGEIYNVGGGPQNTVSLLELIAAIEELTGRKPDTIFDQRRPGDQVVYVSDISKLQRYTGWSPWCSPVHTLEQIYEWWKHNRQLFHRPVTPTTAGVPALLQQLPRTA
jgi:CDP-paratose 2-epimerase